VEAAEDRDAGQHEAAGNPDRRRREAADAPREPRRDEDRVELREEGRGACGRVLQRVGLQEHPRRAGEPEDQPLPPLGGRGPAEHAGAEREQHERREEEAGRHGANGEEPRARARQQR